MFPQKRILIVVLATIALLDFKIYHAEAKPAEGNNQLIDYATLLQIRPRKVIHEVVINDLIDTNIEAIQNGMIELDPTDLQDMNIPIVWGVNMNLHTGWLQNLSMLKRAGKCMLTYTQKVITVDTIFGWENLVFDYRYLMKIGLIKKQGDFHGELEDIKIRSVVDVDLENYQVRLKHLDFLSAGKITLKLEGHFTDFIYNIIIKAATTLAKATVLKTMEEKGTVLLQYHIDRINKQIGKHRSFTFVNLVGPNQYAKILNA